ncbi:MULTISPECIES: triacylglycerol lipase [unclassified Wenzhouxiangella]|uniref:esterase/lipase family protein n=1 Tax=unclassified Wenzhouxiangella TaxID=2613841 RepID=UPI000E32609A|nr:MULTISPECIES: alpha/beta fold hydrolase [unclassified Wenzhouxiangella]RFF26518.1 alpha/beta fold hydrolase [Wenzhouxiangella sp. 15181]RFP67507.1 alpha/beta fold hydrolase [Wenzhouxiangella sp. 15190]
MNKATSPRTVVLVHGLWWGPWSMRLVARRLERAGFRTHSFGYPTMQRSLRANAEALREFVAGLSLDQVDLVGHSLGGLVILRMLDEYTGLPPGRVVLLGSPVRGSAVGRRVAGRPLFKPLVGQARKALTNGLSHAPPGRETGVIAGSRSMGVGRIIGGLDGPNDGTVSVSECRLEGAAECILPVTHTGLVMAPVVSRAVARFLQSGSFEK